MEKINFGCTIFENRRKRRIPFLAAHRGVSGANIPCNTLAAYQIALNQGADVVEIDISKSKDGQYFVFHPKLEPVFLNCGKYIPEMTAKEVKKLFLRNQDGVFTHYQVPTLEEVFALLKGRVYINVDKFWKDAEGITKAIRKAGVERQVIIKTYADERAIAQVERYAPDLMYCIMLWHKDELSEKLMERRLNYIGVEALFDKETDEIISDDYIRRMHDMGLLVWLDSIVYDDNQVIAAGHNDDISLTRSPDMGWGWLMEKQADFIQTDWLLSLKEYLKSRDALSGADRFLPGE